MNLQEKNNLKASSKIGIHPLTPHLPKSSLLINSSFSIVQDQKMLNKEVTDQVLKKVSQTIVSLHSTLVPKTQNIEIYRDLSEQEQQMLKLVQDTHLIHTILAGVLAIDSCLKYINKEETYAISSLMKGVTICLGNYKKMEEQFLSVTGGKMSQNFLKFYDSFKLIISDIHKIPAAKIKKNEIDRHNEVISKCHINQELLNCINREQNLLFSLLAQENSSLRTKLNDLEKQLNQFQRQKNNLVKQVRNMDSERKKRDSENNLTETGSESAKGLQQEILIRELRDQVMQKNDIILKMNDQFAIQIDKYQTIFKRLEEQNKHLKKYNDLDTAYILEELQYEVEMLRQQKRNNQNIINQIMNQMNTITWNKNQMNYASHRKDFNSRFDDPDFTNLQINDPRSYENTRNRCPSVSPSTKQQNLINRYFSPNYDVRQKGRNPYKNMKGFDRRQSKIKRDDSPRFGNLPQQKSYDNIKERVSRMNMRRQGFGMQFLGLRRELKSQMGVTGRSQSKLGGTRTSGINQQTLDINKLKQEMRRSKLLNEEMGYI